MIFVIIFTFSYIVNRNYQQFIKILSVTFLYRHISQNMSRNFFHFREELGINISYFREYSKQNISHFREYSYKNFSYFREYRLLFVENYITIKLIKR
jgi:hypothetical protein